RGRHLSSRGSLCPLAVCSCAHMPLPRVEAVSVHAARVQRRSHHTRRIHYKWQRGYRTLVVWPWGSAVCPAHAWLPIPPGRSRFRLTTFRPLGGPAFFSVCNEATFSLPPPVLSYIMSDKKSTHHFAREPTLWPENPPATLEDDPKAADCA